MSLDTANYQALLDENAKLKADVAEAQSLIWYGEMRRIARLVGSKKLTDVHDDVAAELDRLRRLEAALPKTADGVPVAPGQTIWVLTHSSGVQDDEAVLTVDFYDYHEVSDCYSTREAAEKAEKAKAQEPTR